MSTEIEPVAEELYDKLRSRFDVRLHDKDNKPMDGKQKIEPRDAKYFNFVYKDSAGRKFGSVTISLANETEMVLMMPCNVSIDSWSSPHTDCKNANHCGHCADSSYANGKEFCVKKPNECGSTTLSCKSKIPFLSDTKCAACGLFAA